MEDKVYLCGWDQTPEGFKLWLKSKPKVRGEGSDYPTAEERLLQAIRDSNGAMHAVLEFDPPLPKGGLELKYSRPELYLICGDDRFETDAPRSIAFETAEERERRFRWADEFFEAPICRCCAGSSSPRNERPLRLTQTPRRTDGAFGHVGAEGATWIQIVSEDFLKLLTKGERLQLEFREVVRNGRGRKFYELLGPPGAPFVAVAGLPVNGWRCEECDRGIWGHSIPGLSLRNVVAAGRLPNPLPGVFTVERSPRVHLCVTGSRWRELVGKVGVRGFKSRALWVAQDHEVVPVPALPIRSGKRVERSPSELST